MKRQKKNAKKSVEMTLTYANCELFATFDMVCPLCRVLIPAGTKHQCSKPE